VNNRTGEQTYMRMVSGSGGFGLGTLDFRRVIVFHDLEALRRFVEPNGMSVLKAARRPDLARPGGDWGLRAASVNPGFPR